MASPRGFTLIELLVVIAIIGILGSVVVSAVSTAKLKAQDSRRMSDFRQIEAALEYFYDSFGVYPCGRIVVGGERADVSSVPGFLDGFGMDDAFFCPSPPYDGLVSEGYVTQSIADPVNTFGSSQYLYWIDANRQTYVIFARLTTNQTAMQRDGGACNNLYEMGPGKKTMVPSVGMAGLLGTSCN